MNIGLAFRKVRFEKFPNGEKRQYEIAKAAKISQTFLSQIEKGTKIPSQSVVERLCRVYDVPQIVIAWYGTEEKEIKPNKKGMYNSIKPVIDGLISELIKSSKK